MHHKRKRPKDRRAGCLMCKPHKANGNRRRLEHQTMQERKAQIADLEFARDVPEFRI